MAELYIDASEHVLGRLASKVAKQLLKEDEVFIVNAEKVIVSGSKKASFQFFKEKVERGDPYHGPFYPKTPDRIIKRVVRGMLPKNYKGRTALKRLRVFISVPEEFKGKKYEVVKQAQNKLESKFTELGKITDVLTGGN